MTGIEASFRVNCTPTAETTRLRVKLKVWARGSRRRQRHRQRQTVRTTGMRTIRGGVLRTMVWRCTMVRLTTMRWMRVTTSGSLTCRFVRAE